MLFPSGRILVTTGAIALADCGVNLQSFLKRHLSGDWGDLSDEDRSENLFSLQHNLRLFSAYTTPFGELWIITEADRSATTLLLPEEY